MKNLKAGEELMNSAARVEQQGTEFDQQMWNSNADQAKQFLVKY